MKTNTLTDEEREKAHKFIALVEEARRTKNEPEWNLPNAYAMARVMRSLLDHIYVLEAGWDQQQGTTSVSEER